MSYLLIRQVEKLAHLGFGEKEEVLTDASNFSKYSDDQLDLIDAIQETFVKLFKPTGLMPNEQDKNLLAKHNITVVREDMGRACRHLVVTPYGKLRV